MSRYTLEGLRRAEDVRQYCRQHIVIPDGPGAGKHLEFEDWYWKNAVLPIFATLDASGRRLYTKAVIGVSRWHIKSTSAAALGLYTMSREPIHGAEIEAVATTLKQAGKVHAKARRMVRADRLLSSMFDTAGRKIIERKDTGAQFEAIPHDADTAQGFHPQLAVLDELHVYKNLDMVNAMISGAAGYDEPLTLCITTAGSQRRGAWWELLKQWKKDPTAYIYWQAACSLDEMLAGTDEVDPTDPDAWRRANPASWVTDKNLLRQFRGLPISEFLRYHLNVAPKRGQNRVFSESRWAACGERPVFDPERPSVIGVDASQRRDHTVVLLDQMDDARRHNVIQFSFEAEETGDIMSAIDLDSVAELIRQLCQDFYVVRIPCDRAWNVPLMGQLLAEGLPIEEYAQSDQNMTRAAQQVFDAVAEERLCHGNDPELADYVLNTAIKTGRYGGFRFTKPDDESRIDGAIALAMAVDVAEAENRRGGIGVSVG